MAAMAVGDRLAEPVPPIAPFVPSNAQFIAIGDDGISPQTGALLAAQMVPLGVSAVILPASPEQVAKLAFKKDLDVGKIREVCALLSDSAVDVVVAAIALRIPLIGVRDEKRLQEYQTRHGEGGPEPLGDDKYYGGLAELDA